MAASLAPPLPGAGEAAAEEYAAPAPGTVLRFAVTRWQGGQRPATATPSEQSEVTIRTRQGAAVSAEALTRPGDRRYSITVLRGLFTYEVAEQGSVFRHDFDVGALAKLWPLRPGRSVAFSGRLLSAPASGLEPRGPFRQIGTFRAKVTVAHRMAVITAAGPFDVVVIGRELERRDLGGQLIQRETGEIWFAAALGWQVRADMRSHAPRPTGHLIELTAVVER
jgi:hypothetical protein